MAEILIEHGFDSADKLHALCLNFKCDPDVEGCCCRHLLYSQPDFVNVKSNLELAAEICGYQVLFLPKFHCQLNFIEQCWGYAKRIYCQLLANSSETVLEQNVLKALDAVPLTSMCK